MRKLNVSGRYVSVGEDEASLAFDQVWLSPNEIALVIAPDQTILEGLELKKACVVVLKSGAELFFDEISVQDFQDLLSPRSGVEVPKGD